MPTQSHHAASEIRSLILPAQVTEIGLVTISDEIIQISKDGAQSTRPERLTRGGGERAKSLSHPPTASNSPSPPHFRTADTILLTHLHTCRGALDGSSSNRPAETKPSTSARPVVSQTAPCLSREAWQAWWSGRRRKPPDLSPMPPAVGSQPRLSAAIWATSQRTPATSATVRKV